MDSDVYINEQRMFRSDWTDELAYLGLRFFQAVISYGIEVSKFRVHTVFVQTDLGKPRTVLTVLTVSIRTDKPEQTV